MAKHWQEAQEQQRETGGNTVFLDGNKAAITGHDGKGWLVVTHDLSAYARTSEGVDLTLEELELPLLGWT